MVFSSMFNILYSFLKTSAILLFLNEYFKRNFSEKYNKVFVNLSYQIIYIFSKGQIILLKTYNFIHEYLDENPYLKHIVYNILNKSKIFQNEICQIKSNGEVIIKYYNNKEQIYFEKDIDSIFIYSDKEKMVNNCVNKIIFHSISHY